MSRPRIKELYREHLKQLENWGIKFTYIGQGIETIECIKKKRFTAEEVLSLIDTKHELFELIKQETNHE